MYWRMDRWIWKKEWFVTHPLIPSQEGSFGGISLKRGVLGEFLSRGEFWGEFSQEGSKGYVSFLMVKMSIFSKVSYYMNKCLFKENMILFINLNHSVSLQKKVLQNSVRYFLTNSLLIFLPAAQETNSIPAHIDSRACFKLPYWHIWQYYCNITAILTLSLKYLITRNLVDNAY